MSNGIALDLIGQFNVYMDSQTVKQASPVSIRDYWLNYRELLVPFVELVRLYDGSMPSCLHCFCSQVHLQFVLLFSG